MKGNRLGSVLYPWSYAHQDDHPNNNIFLLSFTNKLTVVSQPPCLSNDEKSVWILPPYKHSCTLNLIGHFKAESIVNLH